MTDLTGYIIKRTPTVVTILMKVVTDDDVNQVLGTGARKVRSGEDWEGHTFEQLQNYDLLLVNPLTPKDEGSNNAA